MSDVRDRLAKVERLVGEKLECQECSLVVIVVVRSGEDAASKMPGPCSTCGRERNTITVLSSLPGRPGSAIRHAQVETGPVGSPQIHEPDHGKAAASPVPEVLPGRAVDEQRRAADGLPRPPRWVPQSEIPVEPAPVRTHDPLANEWLF
jgi:hypothetical protein